MLLTNRLASSLYGAKDAQELLLDYYEKGEEIALLNTGIWQVYRGVLQLSKINLSGKKVVVGWVTPGHVFDNSNPAVNYHVDSISDVYIRCLTSQYLQRYPQIVTDLISKLSYRLIQTEKMLTITALKLVEDRLLELLVVLQEELGQTLPNGIRLTVRFTHQNIADIIGATRVTVTRVLGEFQKKDWIEFDRDRHIIIKRNL